MNNKNWLFVLGILLLVLTTGFLASNWQLLSNQNGGTVVELETNEPIDYAKLKEVVQVNTGIHPDEISIEITGDELEMRFAPVSKETIGAISESIDATFGNAATLRGIMSFGKTTPSIGLYLVYLGIVFSYLVSIYLMLPLLKRH